MNVTEVSFLLECETLLAVLLCRVWYCHDKATGMATVCSIHCTDQRSAANSVVLHVVYITTVSTLCLTHFWSCCPVDRDMSPRWPLTIWLTLMQITSLFLSVPKVSSAVVIDPVCYGPLISGIFKAICWCPFSLRLIQNFSILSRISQFIHVWGLIESTSLYSFPLYPSPT